MAVMWCSNMAVGFTGFSLGVLLPDITQEFDLTPVQAGLLGTAFFFGFASFCLPSTLLLSRYRPRKVMIGVLLGSTMLLILQGWAPIFLALLMGRFFFFVLNACRLAPEVLLIHQWFYPHRIVHVNSINFGVLSIGQTVALAATPALLGILGSWHSIYYALGAFSACVSAAWIFLGREASAGNFHSNEEDLLQPLRNLIRRGDVWVIATCQAGASVAFASFVTFWPTFMVDVRGASMEVAGPLLGLFPVGGIFGSIGAGWLSTWLGRRRPIVWIAGLVQPFLYALLLLTPDPVFLALVLFATGFFGTVVIPIMMTIPYEMKLTPREVALILGLMRTMSPLGAALGPVLVGSVQEFSGSLTLAMMIVTPLPLTMAVGGLLIPETGIRTSKGGSVAKTS